MWASLCPGSWYPRQELNLRTRFRKPLLYPLSYGGKSVPLSLIGPSPNGRIHAALPQALIAGSAGREGEIRTRDLTVPNRAL